VSGFLRLDSNGFTGQIPTEVAKMTKLHQIHLQNNKFTGGIPTEIGKLKNLEDLRTYDNLELGGTIPDELWTMTNLQKNLYLE